MILKVLVLKKFEFDKGSSLRACALLLVFEKFTRAYLFQIALKIMSLPILNQCYNKEFCVFLSKVDLE